MVLALLLIGVIGNILDPEGVERRRKEREAKQVVSVQAAPSPSPSPTQEWTQPAAPRQTATKPHEDFTVLDFDVTRDLNKDPFLHAVGTVVNNTGRTYKYVQVEINAYDDAGNQVGSTMSNVNNLEPGKKWKFDATILQEAAESAKVKAVTGF